jgi:uncharacterized protein
MLRVTADTNIYISAFNFGGKPLTVIEAARHGHFEMAISEPILAEVMRVLRSKFRRSPNDLEKIEGQIRGFTLLVEPRSELRVVADDPSDNRILECAVASSSHCIVSGDAHLLKLVEFKGTRIVTPAQFLAEHSGHKT